MRSKNLLFLCCCLMVTQIITEPLKVELKNYEGRAICVRAKIGIKEESEEEFNLALISVNNKENQIALCGPSGYCKHKGFNGKERNGNAEENVTIGDFPVKEQLKIHHGEDDSNVNVTPINLPYHWDDEPCDGILSMAYTEFKTPTTMKNLLEKRNETQVTIWIGNGDPDSTGQLTIGGNDTENCHGDWEYVDALSFTSQIKDGVWYFDMKFQIIYSNGSKSFDEKFGRAWIEPYLTEIYAPSDIGLLNHLREFLDHQKIKNNKENGTFDCSGREILPDLQFMIGRQWFNVTPERYVVDVDSSEKTCRFAIKDQNESSALKYFWALGQTFLRSHCVALDFAMDGGQRKIGIASSAFSNTVSRLAIVVMVSFVGLLQLTLLKN